ncbi:hypothetical protein [Microbacterium sp. KR10-403]|uniref:hypothetical protein n=1 Tax=Microbacterium sp. KR10-403 TaxID=3158581 RepID=UPI0032E37B14
MKFHTTSTGAVAPCGATSRSCPLAPVEEHYGSAKDAMRALALEALETQGDYQLALPDDWGKFIAADPTPLPPQTPAVPASSLSVSDFESFRQSAANKPQQVHDDWRERQAASAEANGDLFADAHPDTSFSSDYYEPSFEDDGF